MGRSGRFQRNDKSRNGSQVGHMESDSEGPRAELLQLVTLLVQI